MAIRVGGSQLLLAAARLQSMGQVYNLMRTLIGSRHKGQEESDTPHSLQVCQQERVSNSGTESPLHALFHSSAFLHEKMHSESSPISMQISNLTCPTLIPPSFLKKRKTRNLESLPPIKFICIYHVTGISEALRIWQGFGHRGIL